MIKGVKVTILSLLVILTIILSSPFTIYADTYITSSNVLGCNILSVESMDSSGFNHLVECQLDNVYQGKGLFTFRYFLGSNTSASTQQNFIYINGSSFRTYLLTSGSTINKTKGLTVSAISSNNVFLVEDPDAQFIWQFPFESYPICLYNILNNMDYYTGIDSYNGYTFPIFNFESGIRPLYEPYISPSQVQDVIIMINKNIYDTTTLRRFISIDSTLSGNVTFLRRLNRFTMGSDTYSVIHFNVNNTDSSNGTFKIVPSANTVVMPIYSQLTTYEYNSLEFALQFGLSNSFLSNIENINNVQNSINTKLTNINNNVSTLINGNTASNQSVTNANASNSQFNQDSQTLFTIENGYNQDFNSQLDNIDFSNPLVSNPDFASSGSLLNSIFNRLFLSNPFGVFLIVVCIFMVFVRVIK